MATNHTEHYQLNQWEATDKVLRTDFNEDNAKIDSALAGLAGRIPTIATGQYTGTGAHGADAPTTLTFPFQPALVIVMPHVSSSFTLGTLFISGQRVNGGVGLTNTSASCLSLSVSWPKNGIAWYGNNAEKQMNQSDTTYFYFAIGR